MDIEVRLTGDDVEMVKKLKAELAALRLIVTEKFAGADMHVKPEDAADVAKWAANPEAVRYLVAQTPGEFDPMNAYCSDCHRFHDLHHEPDCRVFLAWAALDDPRAAEAIGAAFDRARPVLVDAMRGNPYVRLAEEMGLPRIGTAEYVGAQGVLVNGVVLPAEGDWSPHRTRAHRLSESRVRRATPFRRVAESEQAARERMLIGSVDTSDAMAASPLVSDEIILRAVASARAQSDARGMEAVEDEARNLNALTPSDTAGIWQALAR